MAEGGLAGELGCLRVGGAGPSARWVGAPAVCGRHSEPRGCRDKRHRKTAGAHTLTHTHTHTHPDFAAMTPNTEVSGPSRPLSVALRQMSPLCLQPLLVFWGNALGIWTQGCGMCDGAAARGPTAGSRGPGCTGAA